MIDIQRVYLTYRIYEVYTYIIHKLNSLNILFIRQYPIQDNLKCNQQLQLSPLYSE